MSGDDFGETDSVICESAVSKPFPEVGSDLDHRLEMHSSCGKLFVSKIKKELTL